MRILLIDDEWNGLDLLEKILTKSFQDVSIIGKFQNPLEAIPYILASEPDVVIIDVEMPFVNGLDMVRMMQHKAIHFIITTVHDAGDMQLKNKFAKAEFLAKPFNVSELINAINKIKEQITLANQLNA